MTQTLSSELPQADASTLVDRAVLERQVQEVYRGVARDPTRRGTSRRAAASRSGSAIRSRCSPPSPTRRSRRSRASATTSTSRRLRPGDRVLDLGSGSGTDAFCAGAGVGDAGRVVGVDFTDAQIARATRLAERHGIAQRAVRRGEHR